MNIDGLSKFDQWGLTFMACATHRQSMVLTQRTPLSMVISRMENRVRSRQLSNAEVDTDRRGPCAQTVCGPLDCH